ncbi:MAG: BlaI/MecI/CopY family transcriptional regulator [bacterium]|nr:BlaI/MecI/CopY family transcriptional regulator [bacterium]
MTPKPLDPPTAAEWKILKVVFERGACGAREVIGDSEQAHGWSASTVKTLLRRLVEKGHLRTRRVGASFLYRPSRTIHRALRDSADQLLDQVVPGALGPLIQYMVGKSRLTGEELDDLRAFLDEQCADDDGEDDS